LRKSPVIGAIHEQRRQRSENPWALGSTPTLPTISGPPLPGSCQSEGGPGTNRVQAAPPDATRCRPTSPDVRAGHRPSRPPSPWSAFSQPRYISKRRTGPDKTCPRRAGRTPGWPATSTGAAGWAGCRQGVASHRPPQRATTRRPGGRATRGPLRSRRGLPPGRRAVGLRQADGMPHQPQRARTSVIMVCAPRVPVHTGTHGEPPAMADRISLFVHLNDSLLTPCHCPHLCTAGVRHGAPCHTRATRRGSATVNWGHP